MYKTNADIVLIQSGFKKPEYIETLGEFKYFEVLDDQGEKKLVALKKLGNSERYEISVLSDERYEEYKKGSSKDRDTFRSEAVWIGSFLIILFFFLRYVVGWL